MPAMAMSGGFAATRGRPGWPPRGRRAAARMAREALVAALAWTCMGPAFAVNPAGTKTVCTITINSPDERDTFRRSLPPDRFSFVELVERDRPDWLESARRAGLRCDVLVVSGHYDGGKVFFSDQVTVREHLPVAEMERISCSDPATGLFSQLDEVYLFGCNTLNPEATKRPSCEVERSLVRSGHAPEEAARIARKLGVRHGESSRDRMRLVFAGVPVIYGFAATAPVGPVAGSLLGGYFKAGGARNVGTGKVSEGLLRQFRGHALVASRGVIATDPEAAHRKDVCTFADDRLSPAQKLAFVHSLLHREAAEARLFLERIEDLVETLGDAAAPIARGRGRARCDRARRRRARPVPRVRARCRRAGDPRADAGAGRGLRVALPGRGARRAGAHDRRQARGREPRRGGRRSRLLAQPGREPRPGAPAGRMGVARVGGDREGRGAGVPRKCGKPCARRAGAVGTARSGRRDRADLPAAPAAGRPRRRCAPRSPGSRACASRRRRCARSRRSRGRASSTAAVSMH